MARRGTTPKRIIPPDRRYHSVVVQRLINKIMYGGKKTVAESIVYGALELAGPKVKQEPLAALTAALDNLYPMVQLRSRRVGGSNYQIPSEVSQSRKVIMAMQWLISSARSRKGQPMHERLAAELVDAINSTGGAFKKKEETHRMAEANRAFAHFARF